MNNAEVTPQRACHRPIRTVRGLWPVKGATGGNFPIAAETCYSGLPAAAAAAPKYSCYAFSWQGCATKVAPSFCPRSREIAVLRL